jgi:hypothetical protein
MLRVKISVSTVDCIAKWKEEKDLTGKQTEAY